MDTKPIHSFEISGSTKGLMGMFGGKPQFSLHQSGFSWSEGKYKKFVDYTRISALSFSKYYSTVSITHTGFGPQEIKKLTLLNVSMFETIWTDFSRRNNISLVLKAE